MEEEYKFKATIMVKDVKAIYDKHPALKRAFDAFWENQHMEELIKQTANPKVSKALGVTYDMHDVVKRTTMCQFLRNGFERLVAEHATSSLVDCTIKAITEEGEEIACVHKRAINKFADELRARRRAGELLSFLLDY